MKSGESVKLPDVYCLNCKRLLNGATVVDQEGAIRPTPGSVTICIYCGHLMAFDKRLQFRELTDDEMVEIAGDKRLVAVSRALGQLWREKKK